MGWICLIVAAASAVWAWRRREPWRGWIVAGAALLAREVIEGKAGDPLFAAGLFTYLAGAVLPTFPPWRRSLLDPEQGRSIDLDDLRSARAQVELFVSEHAPEAAHRTRVWLRWARRRSRPLRARLGARAGVFVKGLRDRVQLREPRVLRRIGGDESHDAPVAPADARPVGVASTRTPLAASTPGPGLRELGPDVDLQALELAAAIDAMERWIAEPDPELELDEASIDEGLACLSEWDVQVVRRTTGDAHAPPAEHEPVPEADPELEEQPGFELEPEVDLEPSLEIADLVGRAFAEVAADEPTAELTPGPESETENLLVRTSREIQPLQDELCEALTVASDLATADHREQVEREQAERERAERERAERERAERERAERERAERERAERERAERERAERERAERERAERERAERERAVRERAEREQAEREQAERERAERERAERERAERERAERERAERERTERERTERERTERERTERERTEREQAEREQAEREQAEREQAEREQAEREQAERERAERERAEREQAERERAERERAERERAVRELDQRFEHGLELADALHAATQRHTELVEAYETASALAREEARYVRESRELERHAEHGLELARAQDAARAGHDELTSALAEASELEREELAFERGVRELELRHRVSVERARVFEDAGRDGRAYVDALEHAARQELEVRAIELEIERTAAWPLAGWDLPLERAPEPQPVPHVEELASRTAELDAAHELTESIADVLDRVDDEDDVDTALDLIDDDLAALEAECSAWMAPAQEPEEIASPESTVEPELELEPEDDAPERYDEQLAESYVAELLAAELAAEDARPAPTPTPDGIDTGPALFDVDVEPAEHAPEPAAVTPTVDLEALPALFSSATPDDRPSLAPLFALPPESGDGGDGDVPPDGSEPPESSSDAPNYVAGPNLDGGLDLYGPGVSLEPGLFGLVGAGAPTLRLQLAPRPILGPGGDPFQAELARPVLTGPAPDAGTVLVTGPADVAGTAGAQAPSRPRRRTPKQAPAVLRASGSVARLVRGALAERADSATEQELLEALWNTRRRHPRLLANIEALRAGVLEGHEALSPAARRLLEALGRRQLEELLRRLS